ncbi:MAG: hypothetical protein ABII71_01930 [Candidatus Micrarchaeota archaeon]
MEFDELLITTGVDALVRLVKRKGKIELEECSRLLNIPISTIEEWARVLEEEGILSMEYRLTKIYIVWVTPTESEIEEERESFYSERETLQKEVEGVKTRISPEIESISELEAQFEEFYKKVHPRLEKLEKAASPALAKRALAEGSFDTKSDKLDELAGRLDEVKQSLSEALSELDTMGKGIKAGKSTLSLERIEQLKKELAELEKEGDALRERTAQQQKGLPQDVKLPDMHEIKNKFEAMRKEFTDIKSRNARLREELINIQETQGILSEVTSSLKGHEKQMTKLQKDVAATLKEADVLEKRSSEIVKHVRENADTVERFADSLEVARGILTRFPSAKKLADEVEKIKEEEARVEEQNNSLKKILDAVGGRQVTIREFEELSKRIGHKVESLRRESDSLSASLEDEKSTYLTFQKIKERIAPSIDNYRKELEGLDNEMKKAKEDVLAAKKEAKEEMAKFKSTLKGKEVGEVSKLAEEVRAKREALDNIRASLQELKSASENLNKRVTLLSREARLLELRGGGGAPPPTEPSSGEAPTPKEVKDRLELTKDEEKEFKRKRTELKRLIKKLWEES